MQWGEAEEEEEEARGEKCDCAAVRHTQLGPAEDLRSNKQEAVRADKTCTARC